ncbi:unnamed protein product [Cylicostephanus goldi]|uniref:Uncharacterized protein n=1 Tax=Cylicostephanus goldi TaxID=71465 RepID=A0A3P6S026_CYLGO|nr:unnamed protein product [Cylicostephanus goldi]
MLFLQTSHLSIGSNGDVFSLGSEDMNALVADMTVKVPVLDELLEEGSNTETEDRRPKVGGPSTAVFYDFQEFSLQETYDGTDTTSS